MSISVLPQQFDVKEIISIITIPNPTPAFDPPPSLLTLTNQPLLQGCKLWSLTMFLHQSTSRLSQTWFQTKCCVIQWVHQKPKAEIMGFFWGACFSFFSSETRQSPSVLCSLSPPSPSFLCSLSPPPSATQLVVHVCIDRQTTLLQFPFF